MSSFEKNTVREYRRALRCQIGRVLREGYDRELPRDLPSAFDGLLERLDAAAGDVPEGARDGDN